MTESVVRTAYGTNGADNVQVTLEIPDERPYILKVTREGRQPKEFSGDNLFNCLMEARKDLESDGLLIGCQGARPDVFPSGSLAQMTDGRYAYQLIRESRSVGDEMIDVFAPAGRSEVASVADQRAAVMDFYGLTDRGDDNST